MHQSISQLRKAFGLSDSEVGSGWRGPAAASRAGQRGVPLAALHGGGAHLHTPIMRMRRTPLCVATHCLQELYGTFNCAHTRPSWTSHLYQGTLYVFSSCMVFQANLVAFIKVERICFKVRPAWHGPTLHAQPWPTPPAPHPCPITPACAPQPTHGCRM